MICWFKRLEPLDNIVLTNMEHFLWLAKHKIFDFGQMNWYLLGPTITICYNFYGLNWIQFLQSTKWLGGETSREVEHN